MTNKGGKNIVQQRESVRATERSTATGSKSSLLEPRLGKNSPAQTKNKRMNEEAATGLVSGK